MSDGPKEMPSPPHSEQEDDALDTEIKQHYEKYYAPEKVPDEKFRNEFIQNAINETWTSADIAHDAEMRKFKDPLTGLLNREGLGVAMKSVYSNAEAHPEDEVYAFMVDLDHFKRVNDTHGHETGDDVIKALASVLRKQDIAVRMGGEEFLIVTSNPTPTTFETQQVQPQNPNVFINKLRYRISRNVAEETVIENQGVSAGYAKLERDPATGQFIPPQELIRRADIALYHSKSHGRQRATAYMPGMTMPAKK